MHYPHKTMTPEEYAAMPIIGWHEVCRNVDGFGGVGVRFLGEDEPDRCPFCDEPKLPGQLMLMDITEGEVHAACCGPEREGYVKDVDTGEPLGPADAIPTGYPYEPAPAYTGRGE